MFRPTFGIKNKSRFANWKRNIKQAPKQIEAFFQTDIVHNIQREVEEVSVYPGPVVYADSGRLRWTSEKQRRYVIGYVLKKDNRGNIIPYQRRGTYYDTVEVTADGKVIIIANTNPVSKYITGRLQQGFHADTGWIQDKDRYSKIIARQVPLLRDEWIILIGYPKD